MSRNNQKATPLAVFVVILVVVLLIPLLKKNRKSSSAVTTQTGIAEAPEEELYREWSKTAPELIPVQAEGESGVDLSRNIYFIIDGSGSMNGSTNRDCGGDQQFADKISGARWAVKQFLEKVPEDVNIGLYIFDFHHEEEVVPLGKGNRSQFLQAVETMQAGGGTPLAEAILFGTDQLVKQYKKQLGYGEFRLVVVTDGIARDIPRAAVYAAKHGIPIYSIGLCLEEDHPLRHFSVSYRAADNFADLERGLEETVAESPDFDPIEFTAENRES